ncbi:MAG: hypothetical protein J6Y56_02830 [Fibrobacterales bacterium]|nr:hypothetical protein [Fibrobacterales bacterium]
MRIFGVVVIRVSVFQPFRGGGQSGTAVRRVDGDDAVDVVDGIASVLAARFVNRDARGQTALRVRDDVDDGVCVVVPGAFPVEIVQRTDHLVEQLVRLTVVLERCVPTRVRPVVQRVAVCADVVIRRGTASAFGVEEIEPVRDFRKILVHIHMWNVERFRERMGEPALLVACRIVHRLGNNQTGAFAKRIDGDVPSVAYDELFPVESVLDDVERVDLAIQLFCHRGGVGFASDVVHYRRERDFGLNAIELARDEPPSVEILPVRKGVYEAETNVFFSHFPFVPDVHRVKSDLAAIERLGHVAAAVRVLYSWQQFPESQIYVRNF